ncbi:hypothetical protein [Clostridium thailandense]|uniref:hypothetical protein n=1 Tax=Clostridium thailandense TaxID=2794346 RepID=UPI00398A222E
MIVLRFMDDLTKKVTGKAIAANVVALGAIALPGNCADVESVRKSVIAQFSNALRESNEKAFNIVKNVLS